MPPKTRSTDSGTGKTVPALVNNGYFSEYYLAYRLDAGLDELYKRWDTAEKEGTATARTRVRSLTTALDKYRLDAALTAPDAVLASPDISAVDDASALEGPLDLRGLPTDGAAAQRDLNDALLAALGWTPGRDIPLELISGDRSFTVPVAARCDTHAGTVLVALETVFATDPATTVTSKQAAAGTLLDPVRSGDRIEARTALEAVHVIFTADAPPNYVLVVSGGSITLLDRDRWGEGVYLAANIDDALARHDTKPRGELAAIAALFSADVINPGNDAQSYLAALLDKAASESAGVSKDLRHGVRRSVELLANAVVHDVRERQHGAWRSIDPKDLTRQCLRYLYRIIVLLFAEARPELGILPVDDPDYQSGYSLARLRDVALNDLHTDHGRNATHLAESLALLFSLVNNGYEPEATLAAAEDSRGLRFPPLRSVLFSEAACPLLDRARIPDGVLQQVFEHLCFSREKSGKQRQALSYATLGINQLGAVYEGLMAYSGFLATEPLLEVDKDGDPDNGSWVIPVTRADEFPDDAFLIEDGPGGEPRRVRYESGDFVFRLSGRDRQRSASYYTPEVLTEFTVRHALEAFFAEHPDLRAVEILALTICEPALGSGAFANEAINQLAARYLKAAQDEAGTTIDPERYKVELQKAKAHFAINQTFGVDLNQTAVELAEVSLWLNCMHEGLDAPWFGARLWRGNSLIGARRAVYTAKQVKGAAWAGKNPAPPTEQRLDEAPLGDSEGIHHFLVPGEGWGAVADASEIKALAPEWVDAVKVWRKAIHRKPNQYQIDRLIALAGRVEVLWRQAANEVDQFWAATRHHIDVWGAITSPTGSHYGDEAVRRVLRDPRAAICRLRLVMDCWCSMWMWAPEHGTALPSLDEWLDGVESILGRPDPAAAGVLFLQAGGGVALEDVIEPIGRDHPWVAVCRSIFEREGWFHWELELAPVFSQGGFDLQIGNPPWVRPRWDDVAALAEYEPLLGITDRPSPEILAAMKGDILGVDANAIAYAKDRSETAGLNALLSAETRESSLVGTQLNLYLLFMTNTWWRAKPTGVTALVHPETHFTDPKAGRLRRETYERLRRHFHFSNAMRIFSDVSDQRFFGVNIYGAKQDPEFVQIANLFEPATADRSFSHDGIGDLPGIQLLEGGWDRRPHRTRIVRIDTECLADWVNLFDVPGTPASESRLFLPLTEGDLAALSALASQPARLNSKRLWTRGYDEDKLKRELAAEPRSDIPESIQGAILQGPHMLNGTPFGQEPRPVCKSNNDWDALDLVGMSPNFVPRTNYQILMDRETFLGRQAFWNDESYTSFYRSAHREFVESGTVRTLQACLLPPGPSVAGTIATIGGLDLSELVRWTGLLSSLPYDYLIKTSGVGHIKQYVTDALPLPPEHRTLDSALRLRTLRLNCLTAAYSELWSSLWDPSWQSDVFVAGETNGDELLGSVGPAWTPAIPLRTDLARWLAAVEIDAIVSVQLGITCDQLVQIYRSQFGTLRRYEGQMVFDQRGSQITRDHNAYRSLQGRWESTESQRSLRRGEKRQGMWARVQAYLLGDSAVDLGPFVPPFRRADRELAIRTAHAAFCEHISPDRLSQ